MGDLGSRARSGPIAARSMKSLDGAARHRVCRIGEGEFYPYEEEMSASSDTYGTYKMSTRANAYYARNRWYDSAMGRFTTPDPYGGSATLTNPNSWNRYAYVGGDPVNFNDPSGLIEACPPGTRTDSTGHKCVPLFQTDVFLSMGAPGNERRMTRVRNDTDRTMSFEAALGRQIDRTLDLFSKIACGGLPVGRVYGLTVSGGGIGGQTGSLEMIVNYKSGAVSLCASGGLQAGWTAGASLQATMGFLFGDLGDQNENYGGWSAALQGSVGRGLVGGVSGRVNNGQTGVLPKVGAAQLWKAAASVGVGFSATGVTGAASSTKGTSLGTIVLPNNVPATFDFFDAGFALAWRLCEH